MILDNSRREKFALAVFQGLNHTAAAIQAGYKPSRARFTASRLATNGNVRERIRELHEEAKTPAVMDERERQEVLSEIGRGRLSDFIEVDKNGAIEKVNIKGAHSAALQEVAVTEFTGGKEGRARERSTRVKLHNPMAAIAELNKMDGAYPAVHIDLDWGKPFKELLARLYGYIPPGEVPQKIPKEAESLATTPEH